MRLSGPNVSFELTILGYEYPRLATREYDSNWLSILVMVQHPRGSWSARAPCLLTYEVAGLAKWFDDLASGIEENTEIGFLEPNLSFQVRPGEGGRRVLGIYFELELRPRWAPYDGAPEEDLFLDLPTEDEQLAAAAASLRVQLARYPQRAEI